MILPPVTVIHQSIDRVVLELTILPDLDVFSGHFPNHPILPGVTQIDWVVKCIRDYLHMDVVSARDFQVKFRNIIRPSMVITLRLEHDKYRECVSFAYERGADVMSSGVIRLSGVA